MNQGLFCGTAAVHVILLASKLISQSQVQKHIPKYRIYTPFTTAPSFYEVPYLLSKHTAASSIAIHYFQRSPFLVSAVVVPYCL